MIAAAAAAVHRLLRGHVGLHVGDVRVGHIALSLQLGDAVLVLLNVDLGGGDTLTQGHVGRLRGHAPLGIVQLADLHIRLLDGVLLAGVVQGQLGDLRKLLGLGHAGPAQIHCTILQFIQKSHIKNLLTVRLVGLLALFYPVLPRCARGRAGILANFNRSYSGA